MATDSNFDLESIKEWLGKEDYLPQDMSDFLLKKFLHSCYGSLERTKKCIEKFCTTRYNMQEIYTNRDPTSSKLQDAFSITSVTTYNVGNNEMLIHQLDDPNLEKFDFYNLLKTFMIQTDYWLEKYPILPDGHIVLLDIKNFYLRILPKVNVFYFREFLIFLLEAMPVRIKQIHVFNCPSYYEKLYLLVKPVLSQEICDLINFHPDVESLHKVIDKVYLPKELGGEAQSMKEQQNDWVKKIVESRKMFLDDNLWKADLKKKPKINALENSMNGSFRTLSID